MTASAPVRLCLFLCMAGSAAAQDRPTARATRVSEPITLDGRIDESFWRETVPIGALAQREPVEGSAPSEATEVRVAFDADALYFAIVCRDASPQDIVATQLTRDADLDVDDRVTIVIDPFFDHRNGFFFQVNPSGARVDGQVSNNAEHLSSDWDGIWDATAVLTTSGWQAEIAIPFKTLRFKPGQATWGLNVERQIKRRNEVDRWSSPRLDVWIGNLAQAGRLEGLEGLHQGLGLDVRPFGSAGDRDGDGVVDGGLDVFKSITPSLNSSITVNTDFAETEVDARQINLTRFPLFFPEKRAFFLEGAGVFDVAGLAGSDDIVPFFSRRIGLLEGEEVPVTLGAKVVGRQGDYNVGILDVQTRDTDAHPAAGQNLLATRISRNLFQQSWVGAILTHGSPEGSGDNSLLGADARLATSTFRGGKNLSLDLYLLRTSDEREAADYAAGFKLDYPNDDWDVSLGWKHIGDSFTPRLGFVPRNGIRKTNVGLQRRVRPRRWGLRYFTFEFRPEHITNLENRVENWQVFVAPFNVKAEAGDHVEWNYIPQFEHLDAPFEISDGVVVPVGSYRVDRYRILANSATKRWWVANVSYEYGGFYSGDRTRIKADLTVKANTHLSVAFQVERNIVALHEGAFETLVHAGRVEYNFTPDISWATLVQYDSESRVAGVQSRFRWIMKPGNDLFLVVNKGWLRTLDGAYLSNFNRESVKVQYTFRL